MTIDYYDEDFLTTCSKEVIEDLYFNQYDETRNIPAIDKEDGGYKLYIFADKNGMCNYNKYLMRIFET